MATPGEQRARTFVNKAVLKERRLTASLKEEKRINEDLRKELNQLKLEVIGHRRAIADLTGGLCIDTSVKDGEKFVELRQDIDEDQRYEISVQLLSTILKKHGVLDVVVCEIKDLEGPPRWFSVSGFNGRLVRWGWLWWFQ